MCLSRCQRDMIPLSSWGGDLRLSLGSPQGIQTSLHLVTWNTSLNLSHCREIRPSFESSLSRYISLETESTDSLSPTNCWGKTPLEVLVENWLTSSVKDKESGLILRWYVVHGTFFTLLCWNECSYRHEAGVSENLCSFLKEVKPLVPYSVEHGKAMEPMKGKCTSLWIDLGYIELFCIPEVHQCSSHFVTVFLGTLWWSIMEIEAPYVFDWEIGIALHEMQGNRASFNSEGDVSYDFSSCGRNLGYIRELQQGWPFETPPCSARSVLLCSFVGHLRNLN